MTPQPPGPRPPRPLDRRRFPTGCGLLLAALLLPVPAAAAAPRPASSGCPAPWAAPQSRSPWPERCDPAHPERQLHDRAGLLPPGSPDRRELLGQIAQGCRLGLELLVVTSAGAGRTFSLVDHGDALWDCGGARPDRAVLVATRRGGHARVPWLSHAAVRTMARQFARRPGAKPRATLLRFGEELLRQHQARRRTRQALLGIAALSGMWLLFVTGRALLRTAPRTQ